VVVHNLNLVSVPIFPLKADSILVIDANAVLAFSIASEALQPIAGRHGQVAQCSGGIQQLQFLEGALPKIDRDAPDPFLLPESLRLGIPKSLDHALE
jgi:hypothetical protein